MGKTIHGNLKVTNDVKVKDDLKVSDNARIKGRLSVDEATTLENTLSVAGNSLVTGTLGYKVPVTAISAATTLTAAQSGTIFAVTSSAAYTITLPTTAAGLHYRFFVTAVLTNGIVTITASGAHLFAWLINSVTGTDVSPDVTANPTPATGLSNLALAGTSPAGTFVELIGISSTQWMVTGRSNLVATPFTLS